MDTKTLASRMRVAKWLADERRECADKKFNVIQLEWLEQEMRDGRIRIGTQWEPYISNYFDVISSNGVESQEGLQALGKLVVTLTHALETAERVFGPLPKPGVHSGTIEPWDGTDG